MHKIKIFESKFLRTRVKYEKVTSVTHGLK